MDLNPRLHWATDLDTLLWSSSTCPACKLLYIALRPYKLRSNAGAIPIALELVNGKLQMGFYVSEVGSQDGQGSSPPSRQGSGGTPAVPVKHRVLSVFVKASTLRMRFRL